MRKYRNAASDYEYGAMLGENLNFAASEAYKLLRTNLDFALSDEQKCRIIGITSSMRGEGKSTTTLNLAYSIAEAGKLVLVIEADMRLPTYTKRLNIQTKKGISNLLAGELHKNMWVIPAGDIPPNPSELLGSEQMRITLDVLSRDFDYILLDLPPVTAVSDPLVVSKLVNGMLLVVRQNYATRRSVAETVRQLHFAEAKILGFVMTNAALEGKKKYYKNYNYGYDYGYGYGEKNKTGNGKEK